MHISRLSVGVVIAVLLSGNAIAGALRLTTGKTTRRPFGYVGPLARPSQLRSETRFADKVRPSPAQLKVRFGHPRRVEERVQQDRGDR